MEEIGNSVFGLRLKIDLIMSCSGGVARPLPYPVQINSIKMENYKMTQKTFFNSVTNGNKDILQEIIDLLNQNNIEYCVIGGLAVNAYVEPVVSLDLDIVVVIEGIDKIIESTKDKFKIENFPHSINLGSKDSDVRIQIQTDKRYQAFIKKALFKDILGYQMKVASLEDVLTGKVWAYSDIERRGSKRQKDLADIMRIIESFPELKSILPKSIIENINKIVVTTQL
ncbi:nucleotidyl transferase AbiEii/AbiGii toxin family protein [Candidatus Desantisbacteria bacterium]|nr:nucleotidyl transferase AbiEii/AbiGii toxin family protein [Candidatus Desantisbacteria bacterium]